MLILLLFYSIAILVSSKSDRCSVQPLTETVYVRDCLTNPIRIETAHCLGLCYSDDYLIFDWRYEPNYYRHRQRVHCCWPHSTRNQTISMICNDQKQRLFTYPVVTECKCQTCPERCH